MIDDKVSHLSAQPLSRGEVEAEIALLENDGAIREECLKDLFEHGNSYLPMRRGDHSFKDVRREGSVLDQDPQSPGFTY